MGEKTSIRIGTRGSSLALWQARYVVRKFKQIGVNCDIVIIKTEGDVNQSVNIADIGGKNIFLKELEMALINQDIDVAVHSFKDITSYPNSSLICSGFMLEERQTDAIILFDHQEIDLINKNLQLATGSLRRQSLCNMLYPMVHCVPIRGNIETRIERAKARGDDGLILSTAGLQRLNLMHHVTVEPNPEEFVPAPGQGMIALQHRQDDDQCYNLIQKITESAANQLGQKYFQLLQGISFNCNVPFGAFFNDMGDLIVFVDHHQNKKRHIFKSSSHQVSDAIQTIKGVGIG